MKFKLNPNERIKGKEIGLHLEKVFPAIPEKNYVPSYRFSIVPHGKNEKLGHLNIRIGTNESIARYAGNIGYAIDNESRRHNYAYKACLLVKDLLKNHELKNVWITCSPYNIASRAVIEKLGARFVETVKVPEQHEMYDEGITVVNRYNWTL